MQVSFKDQSQVLNALRFPATLMVIVGHCALITMIIPVSSFLGEIALARFIQQFFYSMGGLAVTLFSLISGYYLFAKGDRWTVPHYIDILRKRFKTLLIPYVLWNLLCIMALWLKNSIGLHWGINFAFNAVEYDQVTNHGLFELIMGPIDSPLWYVRELIYMFVLSPLVYVLCRHRIIGAIIVLLLYALPVVAPYCNFHFPLNDIQVHFIVGAYLALHKWNILGIARRVKWLVYAIGGAYIVAIVMGMIDLHTHYTGILNAFFALGLINLGYELYVKKNALYHFFAGNASATFFMYAAHWILYINIIRGTLTTFLPSDGSMTDVFVHITTFILVSVATLYTYRLMSRFMPYVLSFLSGGRG